MKMGKLNINRKTTEQNSRHKPAESFRVSFCTHFAPSISLLAPPKVYENINTQRIFPTKWIQSIR